MPLDTNIVIQQIDHAITQWQSLRSSSRHDDLSDLGDHKLAEIVTTLTTAIERFAPQGSTYMARMQEILQKYSPQGLHVAHKLLFGVLTSLREAYQLGYLQTVQELIRADVFSDFLEMAEYLLTEGYKDPAAVLIGGVLEEHLRKLCIKHGVSTENPVDGKPRKANALNDDLAKIAYEKLQQKSVTLWLDLRNKAAHAKYAEYEANHVEIMLASIRDFLLRYPA